MRMGGKGVGSEDDDRQAEVFLKLGVWTEKEMRKETEEFVGEHWSLMEMIAADLMRFTTLSQFELEYLHEIFQEEATSEDLIAYRKSPFFKEEFVGQTGSFPRTDFMI